MSDVKNPYESPESELAEAIPAEGGSLATAISGNYDFKIGDVLSSAWAQLKGFKRSFWGAMLIIIVLQSVVNAGIALVISSPVVGMLAQLVLSLVILPLNAGVLLLGVYRGAGRDVQATQIFNYYGYMTKLVVMYLLMVVLLIVGFLLFVIPGVYLAIGYIFAIPLLVEKNLGVWEALESSRKAVHHHWFKFLGFFIVLSLIVLLGAMALGIGLVWALPLTSLAIGVIYVQIFGVQS